MPRTVANRPTSIHLPSQILEQVDHLASYEGISRSSWVRRLILTELRSNGEDQAGGA